MLVLIPPYGINGAACAYLASTLPVAPFISFAEERVLGSGHGHWSNLSALLALPIFVQLSLALTIHSVANSTLAAILGLIASVPVLPLVFLAQGNATSEDRRLLSGLLGRLTSTAN
jgi:hypothetical protein